jgi:DNA-binding NarL/FixJ family response regulator
MLTMHDDAPTRLMARTAGAHAFVGKHESDDRLIAAIRSAAGRGG